MTKQVKRARTPSPITAKKQTTKAVGVSRSIRSSSQSSIFISMAVDMSWRLAIAILVPIIGGSLLDKQFKTSPTLTIVGFFIAMVGMAFVFWKTMQAANQIPVPKLTAAQKKAIKKSYEEDDDA